MAMPLIQDGEVTMLSSDIQCAYCGLKGKIEGSLSESDGLEVNVFKHLGHNPFSGHLHYQCPSCSIVQLVLPMDILEGKMLGAFSGLDAQGDLLGGIASNVVHRLTDFLIGPPGAEAACCGKNRALQRKMFIQGQFSLGRGESVNSLTRIRR
jgi:hypothetical protein